jgi:hypothetical protein
MKTAVYPYRRWYFEDVVRAAYMAGQGASAKEIAQTLGGATAERVRAMCRVHGIKLQRSQAAPAIQQIVWKTADQDALNAEADRLDREPGELAALIVRKAIAAKEVERLVDPLDVVGLG